MLHNIKRNSKQIKILTGLFADTFNKVLYGFPASEKGYTWNQEEILWMITCSKPPE